MSCFVLLVLLLASTLASITSSPLPPTHDNILNCNIVAFDKDSKCSSEGYSIGGSPACFTIGEVTELYLCDKDTKEVLIAKCNNKDCTSCADPENNWYGYVDGICQSNGWLQSECTEDAVDPTRFVWFTIGGPRVVRRCNTCASVNVCVLYYRYSMVNVCALYYVSVCVKTNTNTHERWRKNCWIRKTTGYIDTYMNMYVCVHS